jgi:hypothetical protein
VLEQLLCCQIARLPPIEDRLGDIRREIAEADRCRSDIEQCAEPTRAEAHVDLIGPDVDTFDQGVKEGAPAYSGQLGPSLPDLGGSRDEPALC